VQANSDSNHPRPIPRRSRRKQARPGELLAAALELFTEKGFAATRVDEVARRAGVSKGTLFLYFPSKEDLFKAVVRENLAGRFPMWNAEFEAYSGSTPELLRFCHAAVVAKGRQYPQLWLDQTGHERGQ